MLDRDTVLCLMMLSLPVLRLPEAAWKERLFVLDKCEVSPASPLLKSLHLHVPE